MAVNVGTLNVIPSRIAQTLTHYFTEETQASIAQKCQDLQDIQRVRNSGHIPFDQIDLSQTPIYRRWTSDGSTSERVVSVFVIVGCDKSRGEREIDYFVLPVAGPVYTDMMAGAYGDAVRQREQDGKPFPQMISKKLSWRQLLGFGSGPTGCTRLHKSGFVYVRDKFIHMGHYFDNACAQVPNWETAVRTKTLHLQLAITEKQANDILRRMKDKLRDQVASVTAIQNACLREQEQGQRGTKRLREPEEQEDPLPAAKQLVR